MASEVEFLHKLWLFYAEFLKCSRIRLIRHQLIRQFPTFSSVPEEFLSFVISVHLIRHFA